MLLISSLLKISMHFHLNPIYLTNLLKNLFQMPGNYSWVYLAALDTVKPHLLTFNSCSWNRINNCNISTWCCCINLAVGLQVQNIILLFQVIYKGCVQLTYSGIRMNGINLNNCWIETLFWYFQNTWHVFQPFCSREKNTQNNLE